MWNSSLSLSVPQYIFGTLITSLSLSVPKYIFGTFIFWNSWCWLEGLLFFSVSPFSAYLSRTNLVFLYLLFWKKLSLKLCASRWHFNFEIVFCDFGWETILKFDGFCSCRGILNFENFWKNAIESVFFFHENLFSFFSDDAARLIHRSKGRVNCGTQFLYCVFLNDFCLFFTFFLSKNGQLFLKIFHIFW